MVLGPLGGASFWPITTNGPRGPFSSLILDLSRAGGTPVPVVLTVAPGPTLESEMVSQVWGQELLSAPCARAAWWLRPFLPLRGLCRPLRGGRHLGSLGVEGTVGHLVDLSSRQQLLPSSLTLGPHRHHGRGGPVRGLVSPSTPLCAWTTYPSPRCFREVIIFLPFLMAGLVLPFSPFFVEVLEAYTIHMVHLPQRCRHPGTFCTHVQDGHWCAAVDGPLPPLL
jgi:hypothetical protein